MIRWLRKIAFDILFTLFECRYCGGIGEVPMTWEPSDLYDPYSSCRRCEHCGGRGWTWRRR